MVTKTSMADVARAAGVSKSTVSRALAGDSRVKEATRLRIEQAAQELGYIPNRIARALARGRTEMIAVVTPTPPRSFSDPFYLEFLGGLGDRVMEAGYSLVITSPGAGGSPANSLAELAAGRVVDGAVLTEVQVDDPRLALLRQAPLPFVVLGTPEDASGGVVPGVWFVDGDNEGGARQVVEHLLSLGHRRIACITGPLHLVSARRRLAGYLQALQAAGVAPSPEWVVEGDFTREGGLRAGQRLLEARLLDLREPGSLTAIFASNDLMAIGVLEALRGAGLRVPEDVSVAGFDGIYLADLLEPSLTTGAQPIRALGRMVAELLLGRLGAAGGDRAAVPEQIGAVGRRVVVPVQLRVKGSTGPPRGR
ncbi:LacI family DNA-binding transcriptional regulator [Carboxydochorda subterranea]|uniref:LacI family DNA-binding transcriptional regulator n=1 Tax=Carboxydichorda subterranea TaxID=3109565 RepID=A0ABZ1BVP2_9FIRM|nr:LacI family DNA-binding transcriptional regulator [Limnochorda sp. L945t]WRP16746.1 LacI family DNA-binding transcriptional regulator [Limnochorda sp. L945t]